MHAGCPARRSSPTSTQWSTRRSSAGTHTSLWRRYVGSVRRRRHALPHRHRRHLSQPDPRRRPHWMGRPQWTPTPRQGTCCSGRWLRRSATARRTLEVLAQLGPAVDHVREQRGDTWGTRAGPQSVDVHAGPWRSRSLPRHKGFSPTSARTGTAARATSEPKMRWCDRFASRMRRSSTRRQRSRSSSCGPWATTVLAGRRLHDARRPDL
jgi:hypothetical protein